MIDIWDFVKKKFEGITDKNGKPYFNHLLRVAHYAYDTDTKSKYDRDILFDIALLHDILEDTDTTEEELKTVSDISEEMIEIIKILTRKKNEPYMEYIERVSQNKLATIVKLADLRDNMDIRRYDVFNESNFSLLKRYHKAYKFLTKND